MKRQSPSFAICFLGMAFHNNSWVIMAHSSLRKNSVNLWKQTESSTRLQTTTHIKFDLLENRSQVNRVLKKSDCVCPREPLNTRQIRTKNTFTYSESIKFHVPIVKEKRNGLTFTERSVKICRFHRHIENNATTMQRNRSAHTAWVWCKRSNLLINVFLLGTKLLLVCSNPLCLFARFRLVHAIHEAEMLASSWRIPFERDFQDPTVIFPKNKTINHVGIVCFLVSQTLIQT